MNNSARLPAALAEPPAQFSTHAIPPGTVLFERYEVLSKHAEGAVASVYRAEDLASKQHVALKVFDPLRSADPVARQRFFREFEVLSRINHPGVGRSLRFEESEAFDVLVLEFVEGESLELRLARGRLEIEEASRIAVALGDALSACHEAGVVHRDLKPANIVLHPERGPVVLDFGVAWFSSAMTLTRTGAIVGSPRYLAPEMFKSTDVDERVDIYALGAILFEGLAGRPVREADSMAELAAQDVRLSPPSVLRHRPDCPPHLDLLIARAVAHRPESRFATAREMTDALRKGGRRLGHRLETNLPCSQCGTPLIIDLPICPGCGRTCEWVLEPGHYAIQLLEVPNPKATAAWLRRRYPEALKSRWSLLIPRLERPPIPLAVGVSSVTAEALAAQARALGCRAEIIRARAVIGPALKIPRASPKEIVLAAGLHFLAVAFFGALMMFFGLPDPIIRLLPALVAVLGLAEALRYVRRPLLRLTPVEDRAKPHPLIEQLRAQLEKLTHPRARRLAAAAIARATPELLGEFQNSKTSERIEHALTSALSAAQDLDTHQTFLQKNPRAELRAQILDAEKSGNIERQSELTRKHQEVTEASIAHDLAARQGLEACERISGSISELAPLVPAS